MGKLRNNEKGFGAVEGVLVLVIVVLIGAVGWLVWRNHDKTETAPAAAAATVPAKTTATPTTVNTYAGWKSYSTDFGVSFKYPADWFVEKNSTIVTVSSVKHPISQERGSQADVPKYDSNLVLTIFDNGPSGNRYTAVSQYSAVLKKDLAINGGTYCLIGDHNSAASGDPVTQISAVRCKSNNTFLDGILLANGHAMSAGITSAGDGGAATVAVSQTNPEYKTLQSVLSSMKF